MASGACPIDIDIERVIKVLDSEGETDVASKIKHGMTLRKRPTKRPDYFTSENKSSKKTKTHGGAPPDTVLNGLASILAASTLVGGAAGAWCYVGPSVHAFLIGWFNTGLQPKCTTAKIMGFNTGFNFDRVMSSAYSLISNNDRCERIEDQYNFANALVNVKLIEIISIVGIAGISSYSKLKNLWLKILNACFDAMSDVVTPMSAIRSGVAEGMEAVVAKTEYNNKVTSELSNQIVSTQDPEIVALLTQVATKLEKKASDSTPEPRDLIPDSTPATELPTPATVPSTRQPSPEPTTTKGGRKYRMTITHRKTNKRNKKSNRSKRKTNKRSKNKRSKSKRSKSKRSKSKK